MVTVMTQKCANRASGVMDRLQVVCRQSPYEASCEVAVEVRLHEGNARPTVRLVLAALDGAGVVVAQL